MARVKPGPSAREGLHSTPSRLMGEAANETFVQGSMLVSSGGYLSGAGANPSNIIGVAIEAAENNAVAGAKNCAYTPALPHVLFEISIDDGTGTRVTVAADRWSKLGLTKDANGVWYLDSAKSGANQKMVVVDFVDAVGTAAGRVLACFLQSQTIYTI